YRFMGWTPQQKIVLERNPDWTATPVAFDRIEIIYVADTKAGELALQAGEVDSADLQTETAGNWDSAPFPNTNFVKKPGAYYQWLGMNVDHPKLQDIRVRKAIQHAVDVSSIVEAVYAGTSNV